MQTKRHRILITFKQPAHDCDDIEIAGLIAATVIILLPILSVSQKSMTLPDGFRTNSFAAPSSAMDLISSNTSALIWSGDFVIANHLDMRYSQSSVLTLATP